MTEPISLVLTSQAISSLRESDFDTASAIGEVVDNSLQARADEINIVLTEEDLPARGRRAAGTKRIVELAFGDNGHGMDKETLHRCLQLGYSTRYNDRRGIGRFGVGVTLGAISQCMHIDVWSKTSASKDWLYTYVDLEDAKTNSYITEPFPKALPKEYASLVGAKAGTLVVWRNCDRVRAEREELEHWLARTYRKYIGAQVVNGGGIVENHEVKVITVNGRRIDAFDSLYAIRNRDYPDGPAATLYDEIVLNDIPLPPDAGVREGVSTVVIQMSLLPEQWRPEGGAGRAPLAKRLRIADNEGFSVLRARREVFYDIMPHFDPVVHGDGLDRWWSAEISFDPVLDSLFSVRNVKRGARFRKELRERIEEAMRPTILEARREVKKVYDAAKKNQTFKGVNVATEHTEAEKIVQGVNPPAGKAGSEKTEEEKKQEIDRIIRQVVQNEDELAAWHAKIAAQPCTIVDRDDRSWRGNTFIDIHPQGGRTIIEYNMGHEFFVFVYGAITELSTNAASGEEVAAVEHARKLKAAIDFLFMAYAQAITQFKFEQQQRVEETKEFLESNWGFFLRQFVKGYEKKS